MRVSGRTRNELITKLSVLYQQLKGKAHGNLCNPQAEHSSQTHTHARSPNAAQQVGEATVGTGRTSSACSHSRFANLLRRIWTAGMCVGLTAVLSLRVAKVAMCFSFQLLIKHRQFCDQFIACAT
jgi:hypothetical protein